MLVFVDANILAAPVPRTILYRAAAIPDVKLQLTYSPYVETEALKHQKPAHIPVNILRDKHGWRVTPDASARELKTMALEDTDAKDQCVLAAAVRCGAQFLTTANVKDFGIKDLSQHGISAVHPAFFLAYHLSPSQYTQIIEDIGRHRTKKPRSPLGIHETEIARELPQLFNRYRNIFGEPHPRQDAGVPHLNFRGHTCVRCSHTLSDPQSITIGLHPTCRKAE